MRLGRCGLGRKPKIQGEKEAKALGLPFLRQNLQYWRPEKCLLGETVSTADPVLVRVLGEGLLDFMKLCSSKIPG